MGKLRGDWNGQGKGRPGSPTRGRRHLSASRGTALFSPVENAMSEKCNSKLRWEILCRVAVILVASTSPTVFGVCTAPLSVGDDCWSDSECAAGHVVEPGEHFRLDTRRSWLGQRDSYDVVFERRIHRRWVGLDRQPRGHGSDPVFTRWNCYQQRPQSVRIRFRIQPVLPG